MRKSKAFAGTMVGMLAAFTVLVAAPANAASYGWIYMSFPSWLGNCSGSAISAVQASNSNIWSTNWDYGDDLVYGKVRLGANQTMSYNLQCKRYGRVVGYHAGQAVIRPSRSNQTVWMGPGGVRYN